MATNYHIYGNDGAGGPVDYSAPIATTASLTYALPALAPGSDNSFAVRAFDTVSGHEETNVDATIRIVIDGAGNDVSAVPPSPLLLGLTTTSGGGCRVHWAWTRPPGPIVATTFGVYLTAGSTPSYATPAATVFAVPGKRIYSANITGMSDGTAYVVAVRAANATGHDGGTASLRVVGSASGPSAVDSLSLAPAFAGA